MSVVPRCIESLKAKIEGSICLTYTGLCGELDHLKRDEVNLEEGLHD